MAQSFDRQSVDKLVADVIRTLGGAAAAEKVSPLIDAVYEFAARQASASGVAYEDFVVTSVSVTRGACEDGECDDAAPPNFTSAKATNRGWPFPFSGKFCFWFCPDGVPPSGGNSDECYLICIEWWFPVKAVQ
jgi:hypothetical protein